MLSDVLKLSFRADGMKFWDENNYATALYSGRRFSIDRNN